MKSGLLLLLLFILSGCVGSLPMNNPASADTGIEAIAEPADVRELPLRITGRFIRDTDGYARQWPGTYFETRFKGKNAYFAIGRGAVHLRVRVDDGPARSLLRPAPGFYRINSLSKNTHRIRIDVINESQLEPSIFGGFFAGKNTSAQTLLHPSRQIEFIGDSKTVGYGNTSLTRECTEDDVWRTTDTGQGIAALTARHYDADYQVNAISGRGVVRNYNGGPGLVLPAAYPFALLNGPEGYADIDWKPQLIIISLGTNDFSTPLKSDEKWPDRAALHRDYQASYTVFLDQLRAQNPQAYFILWASGEPETVNAARAVFHNMSQKGEKRIAFVEIENLKNSGCNFHPDIPDAGKISDALKAAIDRAGIFPKL